MKQFKKLLPLVVLGASSAATAQEFTIPLTFDTLPEITLTEIRAMDFGPVLSLTQAASCVMDADTGTENLTAIQLGHATLTSYVINTNASGALSGTCGGNGTVGIYEVSAYDGAALTVSVAKGTATEIDFTPLGFAVDHTTGDIVAVDTTTPADVDAAPALTAESQAGKTRVVVAGTVLNTQALVADGSYTTDFEINVVYR
jgi:hypothetical protein